MDETIRPEWTSEKNRDWSLWGESIWRLPLVTGFEYDQKNDLNQEK